MSQNPYQAPDPFDPANPPRPLPQKQGNPLQIPAIILLVMSALWLLYGIINMFWSFAAGPPPAPPNQPPEFAIGQKAGYYGAVVLLPIISVLTLIGAVCMLRLKSYSMAMTGAVLGLVPICGPCLIFAIPFSIWALVLLLKPEVKAMFA